MRATPFKIIVATALSVLAPAAYGSAHTHTGHAGKATAAHAAAPARPSKKVAAHERVSNHTPTKAEKKLAAAAAAKAEKPSRHGRHEAPAKAEKVSAHSKGRHQKEEEPEPRVRTKLVHGRRVVVKEAPAPKLIAKAQKAPRLMPAPEPTPAPVQEAAPAQETIHVTHDRKQHYSPQPVASEGGQDDDAPRKATAADFLSVDAAPAAPPATFSQAMVQPLVAAVRLPALKTPTKPATIIRSSPTAGVVVGSRVELKPAPMPIILIAPEPLVALYDKRGRLIVPPAMKGSHEVLVHQNVMADSDGLERIQDDEDLSRMRAGKLLVALPDNDGIQTDERLPDNRRYCRPWTAAFLTAMARAHYARFHSPLQVNSAVRTVEFQQRLIRTNGNAAPAEGSTASPHLTGQAVDIAKHGLSMTEIAWLRGYLLPLVQAGKVDVEEEFQQACFHISVYKKYIPQPAPRRTIASDKQEHGTTLAIAMP